MSTDKLGLHIIEGYSGQLGQPRLVKLVDASAAYVQQVRAQVGSRCVIIIRWYEQQQPLDDPITRARQWFDGRVAEMLAMSAFGPIAFEGYNEVPDSEAALYCRFEVERLALMHAAGLHACVGNFSVGTPDLPLWQVYAPMLNAMGPNDWLGLHEYWSSRADLSNPWHVGRWRLLPELDNVPIVVTEAGRDTVEGQGKAGWRQTCGADEFLADLRQYNSILMQQKRIKGACVFGGGHIYDQWRDFDVNDLWPRVVAEYSRDAVATPPAPMPQPPAPAPPTKEEPITNIRIQPGRVCLPMKNIGKAWYESGHYFGAYDDHPSRAEDYNLESMGDTDLGEPLVAPFDGVVIYARDIRGGHGNVLGILAIDGDEPVVCRMKHLQKLLVKAGDIVTLGQDVGTIGNASGRYSAHLHLEICRGKVPAIGELWTNRAYDFVQPSRWFVEHGISAATIRRVTMMDRA